MTSLNVRRGSFQVENRSWLRGPHGTEPGANKNVTLDLTKFDATAHYPNGYIPSGIVLGLITASKKYGPYDPAANDGRETADTLLFGSLTVETGATVVGGAGFNHGYVNPDKLPIKSGSGSLDAAARGDLTHIILD